MNEQSPISRRKFVQLGLLSGVGLGLGYYGVKKWSFSETETFKLRQVEDYSDIAHLIRNGIQTVPEKVLDKKVIIAGGGVSGLSAAYNFSKSNFNAYCLLELGGEFGGNSIGGTNAQGEYPWAAHYLPLPNLNQPELIDFLLKSGIITGFDHNNLPIYDETQLCFDPEERLYKDGKWYDDLEPVNGMDGREAEQVRAFHQLMEHYRTLRGHDGKEAFCIPLAQSSTDPELLALDEITMAEFCQQRGFDSTFLKWYINYTCLDDYGLSADKTSAWAGIHYFASRKGRASNVSSNQNLAWPEGNFRLIKHLKKGINGQCLSRQLIYKIQKDASCYLVDVYDYSKKSYTRYRTQHLIVSLPNYVCKRILSTDLLNEEGPAFSYYPWVVANFVLDKSKLNDASCPISWDNVIYGKTSLGYVNASHQHLSYSEKLVNLTFYSPINGETPAAARQWMRTQKDDDWKQFILNELKDAHPDLMSAIVSMQYKLWGHAMISPIRGFISSRIKAMQHDEHEGLYFAHSDRSGISIFEEAFYQGITASKKVMNKFS